MKLDFMKHSPIHNYGGIPGLTSWLIGGKSDQGVVRLLECSRDHQENIIPHSHRFDFHCIVLEGKVANFLWQKLPPEEQKSGDGDLFMQSKLSYLGKPGEYRKTPEGFCRFSLKQYIFGKGDEYSMKSDDIHSIFFDRGTRVLFFEGPQTSNSSVILEPYVDGKLIPTFQVPEWAFKNG